LQDQTPLHLDREGRKGREDGERGEGRLFEGGDYLKYLRLRRGNIIDGGRRLMRDGYSSRKYSN